MRFNENNTLFTDIFVELIDRDIEFWKNKMENQLVDFYNKHLLKEIVNPKILR